MVGPVYVRRRHDLGQTLTDLFVSGEIATKMPKVRGLRTIKKEILKLIETFVDKAEDLQAVRAQMVPQLLDTVLVDYNRNVPGARDAEVLKAMAAIISKLSVRVAAWRSVAKPRSVGFDTNSASHQALMEDQVPTIMENIFECTLEMINKDFSEFPEHRVEFFNLLRAINLHCFPGKTGTPRVWCTRCAASLTRHSSTEVGQPTVQVCH